MERFSDRINLGFSSADLGQPLRSYAQEIKQFTQGLGQSIDNIKGSADVIQAKKGIDEARRDIVKGGKPAFKQGGVLDGAYADSYNKLMREAYVSSLAMDSQLKLQEIYAANPSDTLAYNKAVDAYRKGLMSELDADTAAEFSPNFDRIAHSVRMKVNGTEIENNIAKAKDLVFQGIEAQGVAALTAVREGTADDILATTEALTNHLNKLVADPSLEFSQADADKVLKKQVKLMANEGFYRDIDEAAAVSLWDGFDKLDELASSTPSGYTPEEWDNVLAKKYNELYARERELKAQDAENEKALKQQQLLEYGSGLYGLGIPVDPKRTNEQSKYDLEALNTYYDSISAEWSGLPANDQINNNVTFVSKTGIVPLELERRLNAFSRSGSPEQVMVASEVYGRIQKENPAAFADLPDETRSFLAMVNESNLTGGDTEQAIENARKYSYGLTQAERNNIKLNSQEWKAKNGEKLYKSLQDSLDDDYDTVWTFGAPDADSAMKAEYSVNFDKYMATTNANPELASKLAYQDMRKTWDVTNVGGQKKFMKYAPETVYRVPGVDSSWISNQFDTEMEGLGIKGATIGISPNAARQKNPAYQVLMKDENGVYQPAYTLDKDGKMQLLPNWRPDFTKTEEYALMSTQPTDTGLPVDVKTKIQKKRDMDFRQSIGVIRSRVRQGESVETAVQNAIAIKKIHPRDKDKLIEYFNASSE